MKRVRSRALSPVSWNSCPTRMTISCRIRRAGTTSHRDVRQHVGMRTLMAVLADRVEETRGKGSVIGIFQAVTATRFPTTLNGWLVLRFSLDDPEDDDVEGIVLDSRFIGPDGTMLASMQVAD